MTRQAVKAAARSGRRPGNQDTRGEILEAARLTFAAKGYAAASVRAIAAAAEVDPALVHHYFGTKRDLFAATIRLPLDPAAVVEQVLAGHRDDVGDRLVRMLLQVWDSPAQPALVAAARTALSDPEQAVLLRDFVVTEIFGRILTAVPVSEPERRGALLASQAVGLIVARYLLQVPGAVEATHDQLAHAIGPTIQRYLRGDLDDGPPNGPLGASAERARRS